MEAEVSELEERKAELLKPIDHLLSEATLKVESARKIAAQLSEKEKDLSAKEDLLETREKAISKKETNLTERELQISLDEVRLSDESAHLSFEAKKLAGAKLEFENLVQKMMNDFSDQRWQIAAETTALSRTRESLEEKEKELRNERLYINDQRLTLQSAWEELKHKQSNG